MHCGTRAMASLARINLANFPETGNQTVQLNHVHRHAKCSPCGSSRILDDVICIWLAILCCSFPDRGQLHGNKEGMEKCFKEQRNLHQKVHFVQNISEKLQFYGHFRL